MTIIKFPHNVARRAWARLPRNSDNGTPEERRAAKAAPRTEPEPSTFKPCTGCYTAAECQKANHCFAPAFPLPGDRRRTGNARLAIGSPRLKAFGDDLEMLSETQLDAVLETVAFMARQNRAGRKAADTTANSHSDKTRVESTNDHVS